MPAKRCTNRECPASGICLPTNQGATCEGCGNTLTSYLHVGHDEDWREKLTVALTPLVSETETQVTAWRLHRLLELGVPMEDAEHLAARRDVDVHELEALLGHGCTVDTGLLIVA